MGTAVSVFVLVLLGCCSSGLVYSQNNPSTNFSFSSFNNSVQDNLAFLGDAEFTRFALQLTPDTQNTNVSFRFNMSGRVLYPQSFKLWDDDYNNKNSISNSSIKYVASFNTFFSMNVFHDNGTVFGEGLAFIIAPNLDQPPIGSHGGYLGLTNSTLDGNPSNNFVAVEFDTVKESYDPDDNHVGLDINSVTSNTTTSLAKFGIEISPDAPAVYSVWIDYNGTTREIRVYMTNDSLPKPTVPVLNASLDLSDHLQQNSYFGFAGSTGENYELNCIKAWNMTIEVLSVDNKGWKAWKWAMVICASLLVVIIIVAIAVWSYMRRRKTMGVDPRVLEGTLKSLPGMPQEFKLKQLKQATNNFDERLKLGHGGFGTVYKGVLGSVGTEVAVKKFSRDPVKSQDDFLAELTIINRLRHKHLVRLLGWCHKRGVLLLVYDYMPNGSLDQHLFGGPELPLLSWERRYNIVVGVASALQYLHNEYDQKVVHRDLKASNVMLDALFSARLGDFGLARALETDKTSYADVELGGVPGTLGYIAPECFHTGKATRESDVFGFGVVVLEVACGRRPRCDVGGFQFLGDWVWKLHREGRIQEAVDPRLEGEFVESEATRLLLLGLACIHPIVGERPKTHFIVQILSGSMLPPQVPPFKPAFVWPAGLEDVESGSTAKTALTSTVLTSPYNASSQGLTAKSEGDFEELTLG